MTTKRIGGAERDKPRLRRIGALPLMRSLYNMRHYRIDMWLYTKAWQWGSIPADEPVYNHPAGRSPCGLAMLSKLRCRLMWEFVWELVVILDMQNGRLRPGPLSAIIVNEGYLCHKDKCCVFNLQLSATFSPKIFN